MRTTKTSWTAAVLGAAVLAACSDDGSPTADLGGADVGLDQATGVETAPVEGSVDRSLADKSRPIEASTDGGSSFTLELTVGFGPLISCVATSPSADCSGDLYLTVHDKPPSPSGTGAGIYQLIVPGAKQGSVIQATKVPLAAQLYLAAFLDDDGNVVPTSIAPDKGDPVYLDSAPFTATAGQTVKRALSFQIRLP